MRRLGKKLHNSTETVEAYCTSCGYCDCGCYCGSSCMWDYPDYEAVGRSVLETNDHTGSLTSSGSSARMG